MADTTGAAWTPWVWAALAFNLLFSTIFCFLSWATFTVRCNVELLALRLMQKQCSAPSCLDNIMRWHGCLAELQEAHQRSHHTSWYQQRGLVRLLSRKALFCCQYRCWYSVSPSVHTLLHPSLS